MPLIHLSDEETLKIVGLDGYMLLRFLLICAKMGMYGGFFSLLLLLPLYSTSNEDGVIGMNLHTMANIKAQSPRLWGPFICMYLFSGAFMYLLYKEYEHFVHLRQQFFREGDPDVPTQQLFSVIVENVPDEFRRSHALKDLFESLFPGQVSSAQIAVDCVPLLKLIEERKVVVSRLEKSIALYEASDRQERPVVKLKADMKPTVVPCISGEETDAIRYYHSELQRLNRSIKSIKSSATSLINAPIDWENEGDMAGCNSDDDSIQLNRNFSTDSDDIAATFAVINNASICRTGFVTFSSRRTQAAACQLTMLSSDYPELKVFPAAAPADIVWENISKSLQSIKARTMLTTYILTSGVLFWASVLATVAFISQLSTLEEYLPFIKNLNPVLYSLLQGQLPVIALMVFISLLPAIFEYASMKIEGQKSVLAVRARVFDWFFYYQMANVYLMLLAGSVFGALSDVLDSPVSIVGIFANALPTVSTFFINFMLTELLSGIPLKMLRINPIVIYKLYLRIFDSRKLTRRQLLEGPLADEDVSYEEEIPQILYLVAIQLTFMVISPFLLIITGFLFSAHFLAWKYQFCYVITPSTQMGGMFWYRIFKYSMIALIASSITMIGYMGIKEGYAQSSLLFPLPFFITLVWNYTSDKFESISLDMAHNEALKVDERNGNVIYVLCAEILMISTAFVQTLEEVQVLQRNFLRNFSCRKSLTTILNKNTPFQLCTVLITYPSLIQTRKSFQQFITSQLLSAT